MKKIRFLMGLSLMFGVAALAAPLSKPIAEVLREPLPPERLSCSVLEDTIRITGPTFQYVVARESGVLSGLEVLRAGQAVVQFREPETLWLDDASLARAASGVTKVLSETPGQVVLLTEGRWQEKAPYTLRSTFYSDGVMVSEITLSPETDLAMLQGIRYEISASGRFTHYLHKRRDNEGFDCYQGALPEPGETVRMDTPTSCLEAYSAAAALAMFTDRGDLYRAPAELDTAAVRVDRAEGGVSEVAMHQHIIHVGKEGAPYTVRAGERFTFRVGVAVAPNRLPHPRWRDLRMFIWVGDEKHPYPSDEEIATVARLGFTLFQMHRLGPPGEPRPPAGELERVIASVHDAGMLIIWTANADLQYAHAPEVSKRVSAGEWAAWQGFNYGGKYKASMDAFCDTLATCLASPNGLADYRIECIRRMLDTYPVDGMYIDDNLAYANCPLWQAHGHPQEVYDCLIELHDMNWRRRQALLEKCPHAVLIDHCSHGFALPVISAFDDHLFGEGYSFPSVEGFRDTFGAFSNMYAQGSLFAGDSETTRCGAEVAYAFDLLTGGGQYCYLDWLLWPEKFPYASGVNAYEALFVKTYNLAQYSFGLYESEPVVSLDTASPGVYAALYHNPVWNENLVVVANMSKAAARGALAVPGLPVQSLNASGPVTAYDVHRRTLRVVEEGGADFFTNLSLSPYQVQLFCLRPAPSGALYHVWGGKRLSEHWDAPSQTLSVQINGPAGLKSTVVIGTGGLSVSQVTADGQPATFFADPAGALIHGEVTFTAKPVLLEITAGTGNGTLERQPLGPDELTVEYRKQ